MEECVELVKGQLSEDRLFLVPLIEQFHLQQNHALARVSTHTVRSCNYKQKALELEMNVNSQSTYWQTCSRSWWASCSEPAWEDSQVFAHPVHPSSCGSHEFCRTHIWCSRLRQDHSKSRCTQTWADLVRHWSAWSDPGKLQSGSAASTCTSHVDAASPPRFR